MGGSELTRSARKGDEFVRCWTVSDGDTNEFFRTYELKCRVSSAGLKGLEGSSVYVDARGATGNVTSGRPGETPDQEVLIGRVRKSDFPVSLHIYGMWVSAQTRWESYYRADVPATEAATANAPVVVKVPFDMWPVTILNKSSLAVVSAIPYDVNVAPFFTERDIRSTKSTFSTSQSTGIIREVQASIDFIAPKTGDIDVNVQTGRQSFRAKIAAPGVYVVEDGALRLATQEEQAAAARLDAGPAPEPPPAPDAGPAPTCGDPGQIYCENASGRWVCNAGTRLDSSTNKCVACGDAGQTYCVDDEHNVDGLWKCNAGTRLDSTNKCVACGALGQTHCVNDPRNISGPWVCNAGLRVDSSTGNCAN